VKLVKALIIPKILYCSTIYGKMSSTMNKRLKAAFNNAIRYVYKMKITKSKDDSTSKEVYQFLNTSSIIHFIMVHQCIFLRRLQRTMQPKYLYSILKTQRRQKLILERAEFRNNTARGDFFFVGPGEWNRLPAEVRRESSADKFRRKCLSFYTSVQDWEKLLT